MRTKTHLDIFSGIAGFGLAARWMGWHTIHFVEIDTKCQKVINKNFPTVPIHGNIDTFNGSTFRGSVDILTGGPPCQPSSSAGRRKGEKDDRWKWPEAIRVFKEVKPRVAVFENPDDLLSLDDGQPFERICVSMENFGYQVETFCIPAACVGAWHERDRVWIIAYTNSLREQQPKGSEQEIRRWINDGPEKINANTDLSGLSIAAHSKRRGVPEKNETSQGCSVDRVSTTTGIQWSAEPDVVRMVHGVPNRVDRIKSLGNAIVPQVAFEIFKAIDVIL